MSPRLKLLFQWALIMDCQLCIHLWTRRTWSSRTRSHEVSMTASNRFFFFSYTLSDNFVFTFQLFLRATSLSGSFTPLFLQGHLSVLSQSVGRCSRVIFRSLSLTALWSKYILSLYHQSSAFRLVQKLYCRARGRSGYRWSVQRSRALIPR